MPEIKILATNVKMLRKRQGKNQTEFSAEIGICVEALSKIERGITDPKLSTIQNIAAHAGCSVAQLLTQREDDL